ncbi:type II toxin-antitoxin system RelE/ParE family toxin [Joostella sp. CR20]|uniref:type II toxin-antitoxin system RelE/ParE family toxin n=1 Tax=Joostella sp. CR20 TaxID=2804312 RepID=UPI00313AC7F2
MVYKISQEANLDIENIWLYTYKSWSLEQADRYLNLIMDEVEYLAENPESGKDYGHLRKVYFRSRVKSHLIFYKINHKKEEIEIIRILHQRMDLESLLDE